MQSPDSVDKFVIKALVTSQFGGSLRLLSSCLLFNHMRLPGWEAVQYLLWSS